MTQTTENKTLFIIYFSTFHNMQQLHLDRLKLLHITISSLFTYLTILSLHKSPDSQHKHKQ